MAACNKLTASCISALACFVPFVGCSSDTPFNYVKASGKVSYEDGSPIGKGGFRLQFIAVDREPVDGFHPRPGLANVDANGNFDSVTSHKYGDGLLRGKHRVAILSATGQAGQALVPKDYTHAKTTPLVIDTAEMPLHIKVPKPTTPK